MSVTPPSLQEAEQKLLAELLNRDTHRQAGAKNYSMAEMVELVAQCLLEDGPAAI